MTITDDSINEKPINNDTGSAKDRIRLIFEPHSAVLIGSRKIIEEVGMTSPELFENIAWSRISNVCMCE